MKKRLKKVLSIIAVVCILGYVPSLQRILTLPIICVIDVILKAVHLTKTSQWICVALYCESCHPIPEWECMAISITRISMVCCGLLLYCSLFYVAIMLSLRKTQSEQEIQNKQESQSEQETQNKQELQSEQETQNKQETVPQIVLVQRETETQRETIIVKED